MSISVLIASRFARLSSPRNAICSFTVLDARSAAASCSENRATSCMAASAPTNPFASLWAVVGAVAPGFGAVPPLPGERPGFSERAPGAMRPKPGRVGRPVAERPELHETARPPPVQRLEAGCQQADPPFSDGELRAEVLVERQSQS